MSDSDSNGIRASAPNHPDPEHVGQHLVIETQQWVPGQDPEEGRSHPTQTEYLERFYRCIQCDVEVMRKRDLPGNCGGDA